MIARTDTNLYLSLVFQLSSEHINTSLTSPPSPALSSSLLSYLQSWARSCACQASALPLSYFPRHNIFSLKYSSSSSHQPYLKMSKMTKIHSLEAISIIKEKILCLHVFQKQLRIITSQDDLVPKDDLVQSLHQIQSHLDNWAETLLLQIQNLSKQRAWRINGNINHQSSNLIPN